MNRLEVRSAVLECERCSLNACSDGPVPFTGTSTSGVAVIGEAPDKEESEKGVPFVGKAGQLLHGLIRDAGFDPAEMFWMNTVSCLPVRVADHLSGRTRAPFRSEINACSTTREIQLELAQPKWLILAGNVPLRVYRPDLKIGLVHGRVIHNDGLMLFPIYNPVAAIRNPAWVGDIRADLSLLRKIIDEDDWTLAPTTCVVCREWPEAGPGPWHWTDDGLPYCNTHAQKPMNLG